MCSKDMETVIIIFTSCESGMEGTTVNFWLNFIMVLDTAVTLVTSCHVL